MQKLKNLSDIKKEYGYILRWFNGGGDEAGNTWDYYFYLENLNTKETIEITNKDALSYISKKTTARFRDTNWQGYETYVELFNILGINKLKTFDELMKLNDLSGNKLSEISGIPRMTISDLKNGKTEFKRANVDTALKLANAFKMTIEEIYSYLYE